MARQLGIQTADITYYSQLHGAKLSHRFFQRFAVLLVKLPRWGCTYTLHVCPPQTSARLQQWVVRINLKTRCRSFCMVPFWCSSPDTTRHFARRPQLRQGTRKHVRWTCALIAAGPPLTPRLPDRDLFRRRSRRVRLRGDGPCASQPASLVPSNPQKITFYYLSWHPGRAYVRAEPICQ
jgi:hypothetical protein